MNNVFVYCEIDKTTVEEVSFELLTKGRKLANELGVQLEAVVAGTGIKGHVERISCHTAWTSCTCLMPKGSFPTPQSLTQAFWSICSSRRNRKSA